MTTDDETYSDDVWRVILDLKALKKNWWTLSDRTKKAMLDKSLSELKSVKMDMEANDE